MSSSTNSKPVFKQTQGSKAAIIRPVNRRDGKQTFVRIDTAENAVRPNARAIQLEDYVAQIRDKAEAENVAQIPATPPQPEPVPTEPAAAEPTIVDNIAKQQQTTNSELTHSDHVDVLRAVAKLDGGYQWIAESNRIAAASSSDIGDSIAASITNHKAESTAPESQTTTQPSSQDLVHIIATAIASVLTDAPESELKQKIVNGFTEDDETQLAAEASAKEEETLRLSPELPRPEYTLPVTAHSFIAREPSSAPKPKIPEPTETVSLTAAAWDVPGFRWPKVTDQIVAIESMMSGMANNCESILSPFGKTIAVTAPTRGQGTTTMSITLARTFAARGKRVLLVDADIMQPSLSKTVGVAEVNWYDQQVAKQPVSECIVHGKASHVCLMPLNAPVANVAAYSAPIFDVLESQIDKVRNEFDVIIIDAGPVWQIVDEISNNSHLVDVAMLVNQDTHSNGFAEARERLMDRGIFKFIAAQNSFARRAG